MNRNDTATLKTVADKLDEMSNDLQKSGITGYSLSLRAMSKTIREIIECINDERECSEIETYLARRNAGMELW